MKSPDHNEGLKQFTNIELFEDVGLFDNNGQVNIDVLKNLIQDKNEKYSRRVHGRSKHELLQSLVDLNIFSLPKNEDEIKNGEWSRSGLDIKSFLQTRQYFDLEVLLDDGSKFFLGEIFLMRALSESNAVRSNNILEYSDKSGEKRKFSYSSFASEYGLGMANLNENARVNAQNIFPNLFNRGILMADDFKVSGESKEPHARCLKSNGSVNYINITTENGYARYYLGRKELIGLNKKIEEGMHVKQLDSSHMVVLADRDGKILPVGYFDLLNEIEQLELDQYAEEKASTTSQSKGENFRMQQFKVIGSNKMIDRIHEYDVTNFCHQRQGENAKEYGRRIQRLNDAGIGFVINDVRRMFEGLGIRLHEMPWDKQLQIAEAVFLEKDRKSAYNFVKKYGEVGLQTFLSIEYKRDLGEKLIEFGHRVNFDNAIMLFNKYGEFVKSATKIEDLLRDCYNQNVNEDTIKGIQESVLKKGKDVLEDFVEKSDSNISIEEVVNELSRIEASTASFFAAFSILKKEGKLPPLEEIKGLSSDITKATEMSSYDIEAMRAVYMKNYASNPELRDELVGKFEARTGDTETEFHVLKHEDTIKGFVGFTQDDVGLYLHSVNIDTPLRGVSIGDTMLTKAIEEKSKEGLIHADCAASEDIGSKYIRIGFVADKFYEFAGNPSFHIVLDRSSKYASQDLSDDDIVKEVLERELHKRETDHNLIISSNTDRARLDFDRINNGYVLTKYFKRKIGDQERWYAVFEKGVG